MVRPLIARKTWYGFGRWTDGTATKPEIRQSGPVASTGSRADPSSGPWSEAIVSRSPVPGVERRARPLCESENAIPGRASASRSIVPARCASSVPSDFWNFFRAGVL